MQFPKPGKEPPQRVRGHGACFASGVVVENRRQRERQDLGEDLKVDFLFGL